MFTHWFTALWHESSNALHLTQCRRLTCFSSAYCFTNKIPCPTPPPQGLSIVLYYISMRTEGVSYWAFLGTVVFMFVKKLYHTLSLRYQFSHWTFYMHFVLYKHLSLCPAYCRVKNEWDEGNDKGIPITGHEDPRGMWLQGSTYTQPWH